MAVPHDAGEQHHPALVDGPCRHARARALLALHAGLTRALSQAHVGSGVRLHGEDKRRRELDERQQHAGCIEECEPEGVDRRRAQAGDQRECNSSSERVCRMSRARSGRGAAARV